MKDGENILAKINEGGTVKTSDYSIAAKGELVVKPLKGLRISLVAAPNFTFHNVKDFVKELTYTRADDPLTVAGHVGGFRTTSLTETRNTHYDLTTQALANYTHDFGLHSLTGMAGFEYYYMRDENLWASGDKFQMTAFPYLDLSPRDARNNGGNALEYSYRSAFARVNYASTPIVICSKPMCATMVRRASTKIIVGQHSLRYRQVGLSLKRNSLKTTCVGWVILSCAHRMAS